MPNWCNCELIINSKDKFALEDFIKKAENIKENSLLSLNNLIPIPKRQEENWYEWNIKNWGTKWEIDPDCIQRNKTNERTYKYYFDTAWSPPSEWLEKIGKLYPTIDFKLKYEEPGFNFKGISTSINGEYEDNYKDYK